MKKILVIYYTQTGQLGQIMDRFLLPFTDVDIDRVRVREKNTYPFPWTGRAFFDTMPESVLEEEIELMDFEFKHDTYDLIVFGYQPWFLSPSLPATSILKHPQFEKVLDGCDVITLIGARNMWLNAQESVKKMILKGNGRLVANIPLIDRSNNLASAVSILHWMLNGEKSKPFGIFPKPGISDQDIIESNKFGEVVKVHLANNSYDKLQNEILKLRKISIGTNILFIELRAKIIFKAWARLIKKNSENPVIRTRWLAIFKYYLIIALFLVSPIVLIIFNLLVRPFIRGTIKKKKEYYCGVN